MIKKFGISPNDLEIVPTEYEVVNNENTVGYIQESRAHVGSGSDYIDERRVS